MRDSKKRILPRLRRLGLVLGLSSIALLLVQFVGAPRTSSSTFAGVTEASARARRCPVEMADLGRYCIDRWEVHTIGEKTALPLSPYYPPEKNLLARVYTYWATESARTGDERARKLPLPLVPVHQREDFTARAVSAPQVLPQGYMTYYTARDVCARAKKRLCSEDEWLKACRGRRGSKHPYGTNFRSGACNVFRSIHPAYELHGNSSLGHLDPRLHLVLEEGRSPLLQPTGSSAQCVSTTSDGAIYDMVGNLDEWIDDPEGVFLGGFFSRQTREGCESKISNHAPAYTDYSLGTRCCKDKAR